MNRIKILDASLAELAVIPVASTAVRTERINSDNTLSFSIRVKSGLAAYIHEENVAELDGDFFDIAWYKKEQQSDGTLMVSAECEHVSYRLNDSAHNVEYFTLTGTPAVILSAILAGTGFTVGTVDYSNPVTFSLQEPSSRRSLLMQFAAYLKGELAFHGFTISLLSQRGSTAPKAVSVGRDVTVISKVVSKREQDENGNPMVSYTCGVFKGVKFDLGDTVVLDYSALDIAAELRVLGKSYDPYNPNNVAIEIGNYTNSLEDDLYRIETESVSKDTLMNGCRIGPKYGFEAVRNDKKARAFFKSDGMKFQTGDGTGNTWTDKLYYAADTDTGNVELFFNGKLTADVIEALSAVIAPNLYASKATIAEVTVDELDTSDKVKNYLNGDASANNYQRIYDQFHEFITGVTDGLDENKVQAEDRNGDPLYWTDDTNTAATTTVTVYPVYTYNYTDTAKLKLGFGDDPSGSGYLIPMIELGAGTGINNNAKGFIYKGISGLYLDYYSTAGDLRRVLLSDDGIVLTPYALKSLDVYLNGFSAVYDADTVAMTWALDSYGRIVSLTAPDNVTIPVTWHSGDM